MSVREGYKMTELGEMPSEWEVDSLINTTRKIGDGLHGTPTYSENSDYYFINGNNLANGKIVFFENTKTVSAQEYKKHYISLDTNSLLISLNGTIGNIARYHDEKVILGKSAGYIIFPSDENTSFFYHYMQSKTAMSYFLDSVTGTTIRNLSLASLRNMRVPILPLPEQQKIADILSTVDEHISDTESLIEKMKVLKQGMMQHLLTKGIGHTEFKDTEIGRIPVEWEVVTLGSFSERINERNNDYNYPVLTISSLSGFVDQKARWSYEQAGESLKRYTVIRKGSFSYNKGNSKTYKCGCTFLLKDYDVALVPNVYISFRTKQNVSEYLQYYFLSGIMDSYLTTVITSTARGNGLLNIDIKYFFNSPVAIPPLDEQDQIARTLSSIDDQVNDYQTKLTTLTKLKSALMQQLLTGKTRVKV